MIDLLGSNSDIGIGRYKLLDEGCSLPIQGVSINWDKIDENSYLRRIDAIKDLDYLTFRKNIPLFFLEYLEQRY